MQPIRSDRRHIIPRHLTMRWFATRGWAFGGAATFAVASFWLRPVTLASSESLTIGFGFAAVTLLAVGFRPECVTVRLLSIAATVAVALIRSWSLFATREEPWRYRFAASLVWLFIAFLCWMVATLTAKIPNRKV